MPRTKASHVCLFGGPCDGTLRVIEGRLPMVIYEWHETGEDAWICQYGRTAWETNDIRRYQYLSRERAEASE